MLVLLERLRAAVGGQAESRTDDRIDAALGQHLVTQDERGAARRADLFRRPVAAVRPPAAARDGVTPPVGARVGNMVSNVARDIPSNSSPTVDVTAKHTPVGRRQPVDIMPHPVVHRLAGEDNTCERWQELSFGRGQRSAVRMVRRRVPTEPRRAPRRVREGGSHGAESRDRPGSPSVRASQSSRSLKNNPTPGDTEPHAMAEWG